MERETSRWPENTLTQLAASPTDQMEVKTFTAVTETHHNAPFMLPSPMLLGWGGVEGGLFFEGCSWEVGIGKKEKWMQQETNLLHHLLWWCRWRPHSWLNMASEVNTVQRCCFHKVTNHCSPWRSTSPSPQPRHPPGHSHLYNPRNPGLILWDLDWGGQEAWETPLEERLLTAQGSRE